MEAFLLPNEEFAPVPMLIGRLALGPLSCVCAGYVYALVAKANGVAVKIAAVVMVLLFLPIHYMVRDRFPLWYHAFFLLTLAPGVLLGGALCKSRQ